MQPQPRVWQEIQAQATVTPAPRPRLSALLLCLLRVPREKLDKMNYWRSLSRAFQRPGQAEPWFGIPEAPLPAHPQRGWGAAQCAYLGSILTTLHPGREPAVHSSWQDLIQISVQNLNTWLNWVQRQPCHPLGLDVTIKQGC